MTTDHRRGDAQIAQEALLDDPAFLREIVERVVQQILEAEMSEHIGAAPYERTEKRKPANVTVTNRGPLEPG